MNTEVWSIATDIEVVNRNRKLQPEGTGPDNRPVSATVTAEATEVCTLTAATDSERARTLWPTGDYLICIDIMMRQPLTVTGCGSLLSSSIMSPTRTVRNLQPISISRRQPLVATGTGHHRQ